MIRLFSKYFYEVKRMTLPFKAVAVDMDGTFLDDRKQFNHEQFDQLLTEFEKEEFILLLLRVDHMYD